MFICVSKISFLRSGSMEATVCKINYGCVWKCIIFYVYISIKKKILRTGSMEATDWEINYVCLWNK